MLPTAHRAAARFVWRQWRRHPLGGLATLGLVLTAQAFALVQPMMAGRIIDALATSDPTAALWAVGALVALQLAHSGCFAVSYRVYLIFAVRIMRTVATEAFARVQRFSTSWHADNFAGATVRKISRGMWAMDHYQDAAILGIFPAVLISLGAVVVTVDRSLLLGLTQAGFVALYLVLVVVGNLAYVQPAARRSIEEDTGLGAALADAVTSNAAVKSFAAEAREDARLAEVSDRWRARTIVTWTRVTDLGFAQRLIEVASTGCLLVLAVLLWRQGLATAGDIGFVLTLQFILQGWLHHLGMFLRDLQQAVADMEDVIGFADQQPEVLDRPGATDLAARAGAIRFDGVRFGYQGQDRPLYDDFSIAIAAGERVGLVGPSGAGKSTFVKLIQRLHDLDGGRITIDGQDVGAVTQTSLRQAIAMVPQDPALFHRSLAENIAYGRPDASPAEIEAAARRARAHDFIAALPQGYDTLVGERGVKLSGGERQRVAIARAMLADRPILILDEATSSLDSESERLVQEALGELMRGRTTIVIAHRLSTVSDVDRILVFDGGRVVDQGSHRDLVARDGPYRRLFETQVGGLIAMGGAEGRAEPSTAAPAPDRDAGRDAGRDVAVGPAALGVA